MKQKKHWLQNSLRRVAVVHFGLVILYLGQLIAYDASKLITPDVVLKRWIAASALAVAAAGVYYAARSRASTVGHFKSLTWVLIFTDIAFAVFNVYTQRGMASRAVLLFILPIVVSGILLSRAALFSTAVICVAAYTATAVAYFVNYFNEGYKIELYGEIFFYSGLFILTAALLWANLKTKRHS